jgi:polyisoprenoid-binding protein YceI
MIEAILNKIYFNPRRNKMKTLLTMMLALTTTLTAVAADKPMADSYKIDSATSPVKWLGKKIVGQHSGNVTVKDGSIAFAGDLISSGEINVDMNTITVTDIPAADEMNGKLTGHLKSPDFFNVAKYPDAKLTILSSEKTKKGLKVKGNLTFIGKTNPIEFDVVVKKSNSSVNLKSDVTIDRTKWDLKYGSGSFFTDLGDKAIDNNFLLTVDLTAKK